MGVTVLEIPRQPMGELRSHLRIPDSVEASDGFLGGPGITYFPVGVTGSQQPLDAFLATNVEAFLCHDQQTPDPIEGDRTFVLGVPVFRSVPCGAPGQHRGWLSAPRGTGRSPGGCGQHLVIGDLVGA